METFQIVVMVSITAFLTQYFFNLHGNATYQYKYVGKKSLGLASFLLHTRLEYILLDKSGLIKMTDSCWPNL